MSQDLIDLPVLNPNAAGIDVGSEKMFVSVAGRKPEVFGTTTTELYRLRQHLQTERVRTVAMESTGVYWLCLYEVLESGGLEVCMVNGRHVRNLPGHKSDVSDSQFLALMHSRGLLHAGFVPTADIRRLQDYMRLRQDLVGQAASLVQQMQKAFERMNLKVHTVISHINGVSGLRMIRAIVAGERDPQRLLEVCDAQIQRYKKVPLLESLRGNYREEHIFALRQALERWDFIQGQITECDQAIERLLHELTDAGDKDKRDNGSRLDLERFAKSSDQDDNLNRGFGNNACSNWLGTALDQRSATPSGQTPANLRGKAKKQKHRSTSTPRIPGLHELLLKLTGGRDVSAIPGIAETAWLQLISEIGLDMSKFKDAKHLVSWLGLAPAGSQSGKRSRSVRRSTNRAGRIFCVIAQSVARSVDKALGGFYRRIRARRGAPVAIKALARKMAILYFHIMVDGVEFVEEGLEAYHEKLKLQELRSLQKAAARNGKMLVEMPTRPQPIEVRWSPQSIWQLE